MPEQVPNDLNLLQPHIVIADFPKVSVSSINCNSLNMSSETKHTRLHKFYGICSLKTDLIFMCDLRMCNKAGLTNLKFANDTFAVDPYCSYKRDLVGDNYLLIPAELQNQTVILGTIYIRS
jgi:hypothetical protein